MIGASSGTTALATTDNTAVTAIAAGKTAACRTFVIDNEGAVAGFYSLDGGTVWHRLPASFCVVLNDKQNGGAAIQIKRVTDGANLSGVYVSAL